MNITPQQYAAMQKRAEPHSNSRVNIPTAFLTGGTICLIGQLLLEGLMRLGLDMQTASGWVSVTLVAASAILTGFGLYEQLARHAGAGTLVPITGFANAITSCARPRALSSASGRRSSRSQALSSSTDAPLLRSMECSGGWRICKTAPIRGYGG